VNVFVGANGSGKSNILEGIAVLASGQSHRGAEARHWLQEGKDEAALWWGTSKARKHWIWTFAKNADGFANFA
jgi:recombinational DNA repair ATPase RecF